MTEFDGNLGNGEPPSDTLFDDKKLAVGPDDVYALPVGDNYLIYAPLRNVSALVNKAAAERLNRFLQNPQATPPVELAPLCQAVKTPASYPTSPDGNFNPLFLGILPTRACNLNCVYCNFGASSASTDSLDLSQAVSAVDWFAELACRQQRNYLDIHFFGGEPFVAGQVIDVVIHRARLLAGRYGLIPRFEVATNGVFGSSRAQFVGDYFDAVVLSLDGFGPLHDRQRPMPGGTGSFEAVEKTALQLSRSPVELCLRICVTQENLNRLEDMVGWICSSFRPSIVAIETLKETAQSRKAGLLPPDPFEFAIRCIRACDIIESYGVKAVYAAADISCVKETFCPVGRDTAILSPDGRLSSCYLPESEWQAKGLDMNIGAQNAAGQMRIDPCAIDRLRRLVADKPRCRRCFCRWTCAGGCHVAETDPGCEMHYTRFCIQTRLITLCFLMQQLGLSGQVDQFLCDHKAMRVLALWEQDTLLP